MNLKLMLRRIISYLMFDSSYGRCNRCHRPWNITNYHVTHYNDAQGCFPLCESCWKEITPEKRLPYYRELFDQWEEDRQLTIVLHPEYKTYYENENLDLKWKQITEAVLAGK